MDSNDVSFNKRPIIAHKHEIIYPYHNLKWTMYVQETLTNYHLLHHQYSGPHNIEFYISCYMSVMHIYIHILVRYTFSS